jgi:hypothetical protein
MVNVFTTSNQYLNLERCILWIKTDYSLDLEMIFEEYRNGVFNCRSTK